MAAVPPKLTLVAFVKSVPVIIRVAPLAVLVGENEEMIGAGIKVNPASKSVPQGVLTNTSPEVPVATKAVICVGESTINDAAAVPPNVTSVAPEKSVPVIVIVAPLAALVGVNEVISGD